MEVTKPQKSDLESRLIEALYALDHGEEANIDLGRAMSQSNYEAETEEAQKAINKLCSTFGINSDNAESYFVECAVNEHRFDMPGVDVSELRNALLHGKTLGSFLSELAYMSLPIESMENDICEVQLVLRGNDSEIIELCAAGRLEVICGDEESESDLLFETKYSAKITPAETAKEGH